MNQKGFTLIELMIVVAIIGILAGIALPKFADMLEKSKEGATRGNQMAIKSAIGMYMTDQAGKYPTVLAAVHVAKGMDMNIVKKYLDKIPDVKAAGRFDRNGVNKGKGPGVGTASQINGITQSTWGGWAVAGKGWRYDSLDGRIWVNSNLVDMNNGVYTCYGY